MPVQPATPDDSASTTPDTGPELYGVDQFGSLCLVEKTSDKDNSKLSLDLKVLGVNSRPSLKSIHCALVQYRQECPGAPLYMELLLHNQIPIPPFIQSPILHMVHETPPHPSSAPHINATLAGLVSAAVKTFCKNHRFPATSIDLIGARGPTSWLFAETDAQIRNSEEKVIASETGITTVTDSRLVDHAVGREGATPMALVDGILLRHPTKSRVCQNIGAVTNLCFIPPYSDEGEEIKTEWSCGLGNMFIDAAMRYYTSEKLEHDNDGSWGSQGTVNQGVVDRFLDSNKYINHLTPKSTGRETLADNEAQALIEECLFLGMSKYDTIATITRITARNIVKQYRALLPTHLASDRKVDEIFVCGDGAKNPNIMAYLRRELGDASIKVLGDIGIPADAEEAISLAQHALESLLSTYAVPAAPGSSELDTGSGKITPGRRWNELTEKIMRFGEGKPLPTVKRIIVDRKEEKRSSTDGGKS